MPWITRIECPVCGRPEACGDCRRRSDAAFVLSRSAVRYNAFIRGLLALYKYRGHEALAPLLGGMMQVAYILMLAELGGRDASFGFDAVVPVPLSAERLAERGFNQAERFAVHIAGLSGIPVVEALRRTRHSAKQSFKTRGDRLRDTRDLFEADLAAYDQPNVREIRNGAGVTADFRGTGRMRILLVDDIYTTGGTVNACAAALAGTPGLRRFRPEIYVLTLARS
ncbi:ComF family protein [Paenibacillus humicola]|uniref:ComF family protein n=1 Tax=Paenibacillus humicola TaxID=3110540 RepID=UPI00237C36E9|nr:ComF family protein [Paenibacillus humicola]